MLLLGKIRIAHVGFFDPVSWTAVGCVARYPFIRQSGDEPDL